jgi:hypothetical protein
MTPDATDLSFLFPYPQGHYACICSRCLNRIAKEEIALCILKPNSLLAFEEYRYCEGCQRQAGCTPCRSTDTVLVRLTKELREHPRFRPNKVQFEAAVQTAKANRTKLARKKDKERTQARDKAADPWVIPGFLTPLAAAMGKVRR